MVKHCRGRAEHRLDSAEHYWDRAEHRRDTAGLETDGPLSDGTSPTQRAGSSNTGGHNNLFTIIGPIQAGVVPRSWVALPVV